MTKATDKYLANCVDTETARIRLKELLTIPKLAYPETVQEVFVSEHRDKENRQEIDSLWIFTKNYIGEFKRPLREDDWDIVVIDRSIRWINMTKRDFDLITTSSESRFTIELILDPAVSATLRATGDNCLSLLALAKKRFFPNLYKVKT